jgi:N6-L-threonylcarbamoyladenine synthase
MLVLGIETSCDETAAAVVKDGRHILSSIVASSLAQHRKYGGIIPEIASRSHMETIGLVVKEALNKSRYSLNDIDAVAVTANPGLIGSLLVGISFARALSFALEKPLLEVDHVQAHLYANLLDGRPPALPAIGLVVSGGHTSLYYLRDLHACQLIGRTVDDAAGEAFDKVAKILDLGYPGGPIIDKLSRKGNAAKVRFNCSAFADSLNFSFSGVKTSVLYYTRDKWNKKKVSLADIAASFQEAVVNNLVAKALQACKIKKVKTLMVGGGVAANSRLREALIAGAQKAKVKAHFPAQELCLDNAAMVAAMACYQVKNGGRQK